MNYSEIIDALDNATEFELFRLKSAIEKMLEDPKRINGLKRNLRKGQEVEYFDPDGNRQVKATIVEFKRTKVLVQNIEDRVYWNIPYYYINIDGSDTTISRSGNNKGLDRNEVKVGDKVGFLDSDNIERYGSVIRLNQKTVTMNCDGHKWRVSYSFLFKVLEPDYNLISEQ